MGKLRRSSDRRTLLHDAAFSGVLALSTVAPLTVVPDSHFLYRALPWSLLMCAAVALRRLVPLGALVTLAVAGIGLVNSVSQPIPALLAVPIVVYSVGRHQRLPSAVAVAIFGVVGGIAGPMSWLTQMPPAYRFLGTTMLVLLCFAIVALAFVLGRLVRERHLMQMLDREIVTERFAAAQRASEQELALAEGRARVEVAQELHDVLAHSLSVIVVQAEGAKALISKRPEATGEALGVIAETGRTSIEEVRRIVAVMRGDERAPSFGPAPSLNQIPDLIERAGDRITLTVHGEPPLVPESLGLTAFRVVQESVTNFLKHAGPTAQATMEVTYSPQSIDVVVRDDGMGSLSASDGRGSGLAGMRERVASMGGELHAAPRAGGGYEVRARLPMPSQLGKGWLRGA